MLARKSSIETGVEMKLPCDECKGQCCTFPVFSNEEWNAVSKSVAVPPMTVINQIKHTGSYRKEQNGSLAVMIHLPNGACPFLKNGKCSIYYLRPKVCRDYGMVENLPCAYLYPENAKQKHNERLRESRCK